MSRKLSLLIADDDANIVESLKNQLTYMAAKFRQQIEIVTASSAVQVLNLLAQRHIDALFLDYHFEGGMSGDEIIDQISDPFEERLIFLISARDQAELEGLIIRRHRDLGVRFKFLRKPFEVIELESKYLEMEHHFSNRPYPFPLAYPMEAFRACTTNQGRLTALKDIIEALVAFSAAVLTADCDRLGILGGLQISLAPNVAMTLGAWLKWLGRLLDAMHKQGDVDAFMPELLALLSPTSHGNDWIKFLYQFKNDIRDSELGHGTVKEEGWYGILSQRYDRDVRTLFRDYSFTSRYPLVVVEEMDFSGTGKHFVYRGRSLMGTSVPFRSLVFNSSECLKKGEVFVRGPERGFLSLYPLVMYGVCDKCTLGRVYLLDWHSKMQPAYRAHCSHRLQVSNSVRDSDARYATLAKVLFSA